MGKSHLVSFNMGFFFFFKDEARLTLLSLTGNKKNDEKKRGAVNQNIGKEIEIHGC